MDAYIQEIYDLFMRDEIGSAEVSLLLDRHKVQVRSSHPPKPDTLMPPPPAPTIVELHDEDLEEEDNEGPTSEESDLLEALAFASQK